MTSAGTHNLHDETGTATGFAKVLFFTEAIPGNVRDELPTHYEIVVCRWQKDLIIAFDPAYFVPDRDKRGKIKQHYKLNNPGIALVTPHRGTFWIKGKLLDDHDGVWEKTALICAHWINAAFPPYIRGERILRPRWWKKQQKFTIKLTTRLRNNGYEVLGGGDLNTPYGVDAFETVPWIHEVGHHFDRIFSTKKLKNVKYMSKKGSDHPRLFADAA